MMDPDATLILARQALTDGDTDTAAECFESLDAWIVNGGYLPREWS